MLAILSRYWWVLAIRGVAAILFGIAALVWTSLTLLTLIYLFGAFALVDGVFALAIGINHLFHHDTHVWTSLLQGLTSIIVGILAFAFPGWTALAFVFLIAAWAIVTGVLEIAAAIRLRDEIEGEWVLSLAGALSLLFGLVLIAFPRSGALAVIWIIGVFSIVTGVSLLYLGLRLRSLGRQLVPRATRHAVPM